MSRHLSILLLFVGTLFAATPSKTGVVSSATEKAMDASGSARLPLKRVVLYKSGVGYFEHTGHVRGNENIHIDFTTGQLNDALKSLTAVDLSGGQIGGIRYDNLAPLDYRLKALRLPLGQQTSRAALLTALRGARVQLTAGRESAGQIVVQNTHGRGRRKFKGPNFT